MAAFIRFGNACFLEQFSTLKNLKKKYDAMDYFATIRKK